MHVRITEVAASHLAKALGVLGLGLVFAPHPGPVHHTLFERRAANTVGMGRSTYS